MFLLTNQREKKMFPSKIASLYAIVEKPKRGRPRKTEKTKTVPRGTTLGHDPTSLRPGPSDQRAS